MARTHRVTLRNHPADGFDSRPGETLLEAADREGIALPRGCVVGSCRMCAAKLLGGRVRMRGGSSLTPELVDAHVVLMCIAVPESDVTVAVGRPDAPLLKPEWILPWTE